MPSHLARPHLLLVLTTVGVLGRGASPRGIDSSFDLSGEPVGGGRLIPSSSSQIESDGTAMGTAARSIARGPESFVAALAGVRLPTNGAPTLVHSLDGSGMLTRLWVTNADERVWFQIFVDGEREPSIQFSVFEAVGIGFDSGLFAGSEPFGNNLFGKIEGGCYLNIQVPFGNGLRITSSLAPGTPAPRQYPSNRDLYIQLRGLRNVAGVTLGSLRLPASARLRVHRQVNR
eukprot:SAG31_NODE_11147_length_1061_cov_0.796258_1_plen_230_part_10